jgi:hypothetical protein
MDSRGFRDHVKDRFLRLLRSLRLSCLFGERCRWLLIVGGLAYLLMVILLPLLILSSCDLSLQGVVHEIVYPLVASLVLRVHRLLLGLD